MKRSVCEGPRREGARLLARVAGGVATVVGSSGWAQIGVELSQALQDGDFSLDLRYRYEFVDDETFSRDANASTLQTRLAYESASMRGFVLAVNLDDVRAIGADNYNSTRNGKTQFPRVPDPAGTELNLASVAYTGLEGATIIIGRQATLRGNGRLVANTPWRQNETTYDAASITYEVSERLSIFYSYADRVNRTFGPDPGSPSKSFGGPINLLDATYTHSPMLNVVGYGYWLDLDGAPEAPFFSTRTLGTRVTGAYGFGEGWSLSYAAEHARQTSLGDNPNDYDADFSELELGIRRDGLAFRVVYESHGGSSVPGQAFQAPIGRVHLFRGWADKFAVTPSEGVEDFFIALDADILRGRLTVAYHDFSAEAGGADYGNELDVAASWAFAERYGLYVGFARYRAKGFSTDTDKVWMMLSAGF